MLISITEYAKKHKKDRSSVLRKAQKGNFKSAKKIGKYWVIDSEEPYTRKSYTWHTTQKNKPIK